MFHFDKPLANLTAADLMSTNLITVPEDMLLAAAAKQLADDDIRGAPVVDVTGHCVGVISTTDFMRAAGTVEPEPKHPCGSEFYSPWQLIDPNKLPARRVGHIMSKHPYTVARDTPIATLARMMVDTHVHRLIVVQDGDLLLGVVSAADLLDALATLQPEPMAAAGA